MLGGLGQRTVQGDFWETTYRWLRLTSTSSVQAAQPARYCALSGVEGCNIGQMVQTFLEITQD